MSFHLHCIHFTDSHLIYCRLHKRHTAEYLGKRTLDCAEDFDIIMKLLGFCGDNANVNPATVDSMEKKLPATSPAGRATFVGCVGHINDLSVKVNIHYMLPSCMHAQFISKKMIKKGLDDYDASTDYDEEGNLYIEEDEDDPDEVDQAAVDEVDAEQAATLEAALDTLSDALKEVQELTDDDRKHARAAVTKVCLLVHLFVCNNSSVI
ncbi:hypothetical protein BDZ89DRAFT_970260 [Hymenopellis radicata]|nr:hypothetical protein BDZ89DRAFT_970260 [Hymenopellis radicata]